MADETIRYRAEVDTSALQAQLAFVKQEMGAGLQGALSLPGQHMAGMSGAYNMAASDIAAVRAFAPSAPMIPAGGLQANAFRAAEQTGFFGSALTTSLPGGLPFIGGMSIAGPPRGVFADEYQSALMESQAQSRGLAVTGALGSAIIPGALSMTPGLGASGLGGALAGKLGLAAGGLGATVAAAVPPTAVFLAAAAAGNYMVEGARERVAVENTLRGRTQLDSGQRMRAVEAMADLASEDIELNFEDTTQILMKGLQRGAFARTGNVEEFTTRMKELMENVKLFAKAFSTTEAEAADMVMGLKSAGILQPGTQAAKDLAFRVRGIAQMTGQDPNEIFAGLGPTVGGFRQVGVTADIAGALAAQNKDIVTRLQEGASPVVKQAFELLGGGDEVSRLLGEGQRNLVSGRLGQDIIFAALDPETRQIDQDRLQRVLSGDATELEIMRASGQAQLQIARQGPAALGAVRGRMGDFRKELATQLFEDPSMMRRMGAVRARGRFGRQDVTEDEIQESIQAITGFDRNMMEILGDFENRKDKILADIEAKARADQAKFESDHEARLNSLYDQTKNDLESFGSDVKGVGRDILEYVKTTIAAGDQALGKANRRTDEGRVDVIEEREGPTFLSHMKGLIFGRQQGLTAGELRNVEKFAATAESLNIRGVDLSLTAPISGRGIRLRGRGDTDEMSAILEGLEEMRLGGGVENNPEQAMDLAARTRGMMQAVIHKTKGPQAAREFVEGLVAESKTAGVDMNTLILRDLMSRVEALRAQQNADRAAAAATSATQER